jgi:hypothetical protein
VPVNHLGLILSESQVGQENTVSSSLMKNHLVQSSFQLAITRRLRHFSTKTRVNE